jgi:hypothetical protein
MPPPLTGSLVLIAFACVAAGVLWRRGLLRPGDFDTAPPRRGALGPSDLLVALGIHFVGSGLASLVLRALFGQTDPAVADPRTYFVNMVAFQAGTIPGAVYVIARASQAIDGGLSGFGLGIGQLLRSPRHALPAFLAVMPLVLGISAVVSVALVLTGGQIPAVGHEVLKVIVNHPDDAHTAGLIVMAVFSAPVLEELLFRGLVQTVLINARVALARWPAIALASILFASVHLPVASVHALPALVVLSLGLGWVYERTGNLWASIGLHALFNASQVALGLMSTLLPEPA